MLRAVLEGNSWKPKVLCDLYISHAYRHQRVLSIYEVCRLCYDLITDVSISSPDAVIVEIPDSYVFCVTSAADWTCRARTVG